MDLIKDTQSTNRNLMVVNLGLVANILLAVIKSVVGIIGHSTALLADGIMSTSDVVYYLVVAVFMRMSNKPADQEHPFGHSQLESIAALTVSAFVLTTGVSIFWDAVNSVYDRVTGQTVAVAATGLAFWVAVSTVVLKIALFIYTQNIGRKNKSVIVMALAYDHRNDIFSAGAALIGITLGRLGFSWVDPLAAAMVAVLILRTGFQILRESAAELMDTVPSKELEDQTRAILQGVAGINGIEEIRAHRFGPYLTMNLTICVDGDISVQQGDEIANHAEAALRRQIDRLQVVHIHYHPHHSHI